MFMDITPFGAYAGAVVPQGVEITTPVDAVVSLSAELPANGAQFFGPIGKANLTAVSQNLPSKPADSEYDSIICLVESTSAQSTNFRIFDSGSGQSAVIPASPGIYVVGSLPSAPTRFNAAAAPAGTVSVTFVYAKRIGVE